eukprot:scaffold60534_cov20-Tisochrysis_lutea.AAC.1
MCERAPCLHGHHGCLSTVCVSSLCWKECQESAYCSSLLSHAAAVHCPGGGMQLSKLRQCKEGLCYNVRHGWCGWIETQVGGKTAKGTSLQQPQSSGSVRKTFVRMGTTGGADGLEHKSGWIGTQPKQEGRQPKEEVCSLVHHLRPTATAEAHALLIIKNLEPTHSTLSQPFAFSQKGAEECKRSAASDS